jgi:uncharacterized protein (DUF427 family)
MQPTTNPSPGFQSRPDHEITVEPYPGTVTVRVSDAIIASSRNAKVLRETGHDPVFYVPFEDIYFEFLERTDTTSHCPFKGDASYWRASAVGEAVEDAMWAYEHPYDEMLEIKDHGAFYPDKVNIEANPNRPM